MIANCHFTIAVSATILGNVIPYIACMFAFVEIQRYMYLRVYILRYKDVSVVVPGNFKRGTVLLTEGLKYD